MVQAGLACMAFVRYSDHYKCNPLELGWSPERSIELRSRMRADSPVINWMPRYWPVFVRRQQRQHLMAMVHELA